VTTNPETWSEGWWKKHWFGVLLLVILASYLGYERGRQDGERKVYRRIAAEYPGVARAMERADSLAIADEPERDPEEQYEGNRGR